MYIFINIFICPSVYLFMSLSSYRSICLSAFCLFVYVTNTFMKYFYLWYFPMLASWNVTQCGLVCRSIIKFQRNILPTSSCGTSVSTYKFTRRYNPGEQVDIFIAVRNQNSNRQTFPSVTRVRKACNFAYVDILQLIRLKWLYFCFLIVSFVIWIR